MSSQTPKSRRIWQEARALLGARLEQVNGQCLVPMKRGADPSPVFVLPGGDGGLAELTVYMSLVRGLPARDTVFGLVTCAREAERAKATVESLATEFLAAVRAQQPAGPYRLVGECTGGMVSFEVAQRLRAMGEEVTSLVLLDTWSPTFLGALNYRYETRVRSKLHGLAGAATDLLRATRGARRPAGIRRFLTEVRQVALKPGRRHMDMALDYVPTPWAGPLTLLVSSEFDREDFVGPWRAVAPQLRVRVAPGTHETYLRAHALETASVFRACLEEAP